MKSVVRYDEYHEADLKPPPQFEEYVALVHQDVQRFFSADALLATDCPACRSGVRRAAFERFGLAYVECESCASLYVTPRPSERAVTAYYQQSTARRYWREELARCSAVKREEKIHAPRSEWVLDSIREYVPHAAHIVDVGTSYQAQVRWLNAFLHLRQRTALIPWGCRGDDRAAPDLSVLTSFEECTAFHASADVVTLFEVVDRAPDVERLFGAVTALLRPGGVCFATSIVASGFDIQVLWQDAGNLFPPDRMNVLSIEGWQALAARHGLECLEVSTPGLLDLEIVERAMRRHPAPSVPRVVEYLVRCRDADVKQAFQEFLQASRLSSYARFVMRKST